MSKCKRIGGKIEMCDGISECLKMGWGDFHLVTLENMQTGDANVVLRAGKSKKNDVTLNYCPACGGDIQIC